MKLKFSILISLLITIVSIKAQTNALAYRSEYEKVGDVIYDINHAHEGSVVYSITSGNNNSYYTINSSTGIITINNTIPDVFNIIHTDILQISASGTNYSIEIVDAYDYFIQNLSPDYAVLDEHNEKYIDETNEWTAMNNLWGKGDAIPNTDFRIATIHKTTLPTETILLWDVPSKASNYGGAAVWCYNNVFWGNRMNTRENLPNFPFQISALSSLALDFDFEQLFGNDQYKMAMNMFLTDEAILSKFSENDGDFFFVFDQKGTWIPNYPFSLPDTNIGGKPFAWRYDDELNEGDGYERRRVIIKDNEQFLSGRLDLKSLFDTFIAAGYMNPDQSIYHIQLGIEVTEGYGAVRFNEADISMTQDALSINDFNINKIKVYPNPSNNIIYINSPQPIQQIKLFSVLGKLVYQNSNFKGNIDVSNVSKGVYFLKIISEDGLHFTKKIIVN